MEPSLIKYTDEYGKTYGTEEFSHFLYSFVRLLLHPDVILELPTTGFGGCLHFGWPKPAKENGKGHVWICR